MTQIRILEIVEATSAGTRRHVTDLIGHLDRRRFSVTLVCATLREKGFLDDIQRMREHGVEVFIIQMVRNISPWRDFADFFRILKIIRMAGSMWCTPIVPRRVFWDDWRPVQPGCEP